MKKALIAMSGGVDSSVAAYITSQKGFDCIGATMKLFQREALGLPSDPSCCTKQDIADAKSVAALLGIDHFVFDFSDSFREKVIDKFISSYENGLTPNPCIDCNRYLKFEQLFSHADRLSCDYIVTGHYARAGYDEASGRYILKKASDPSKDQSYVLYSLTQSKLSRVFFPLGSMSKSEVRALAEKQGFVNADKHDSQDICFVKGCSYSDFIEEYTGRKYPHGNFLNGNGDIIGEHKGIIRYTIGQRKGLGISAAEPLYVSKVDSVANTVVLETNDKLFSKKLNAENINLISVSSIESPMRVKAKVRYRHIEQPATVIQTDDDKITVEFDTPQRAVTKGQAVVLYDGDTVVGGGTITEV